MVGNATKVCSLCRIEKNLSEFPLDKNKRDGRNYYCLVCSMEKKREERRTHKEKYGLTPIQMMYKKRPNVYKLRGYIQYDKKKGVYDENGDYFDLEGIDAVLKKSHCVYCGAKRYLGLDRIDNSKGHTKENVVVCCKDCNWIRGDRYTLEEMKIIGKAMRSIRRMREKDSLFNLPEVNHGHAAKVPQ